MSNAHHPDDFCVLVKLINHPVISNTNAPVAVGTNNLAAPGRSWVLGQSLNFTNDPVKLLSLGPFEITLRPPLKENLIHSGGAP